ncbi:hypothetical protein [Planobispora takensis]|uniref:DRBM domain-containing protein n=1 Tax=Planobispora takensis TaxID=1367882 RepID=A0A8J3T671_9ACTN|nr:hypothetical protein [Planobispora takensis]GII04905.1 hypothetical protein Pta02_69130 [Planobispora takensis]
MTQNPSFSDLWQDDERLPASPARGGPESTRAGGQESERSFFCRICQRSERGRWVPAGWYLLERAPGGKGRHLRLGLYCSVDCLVRAGQLLEEGAATHARRLDLPSEAERRRERERVVEVAQTLLSGGMSIRQAADQLTVPAFTLKTWLREAGVRIEAATAPQQAARVAVAAAAGSAGQRPTVEHHPVSVLNEWEQQGRIGRLEWEVASTGPAHAPVFCAVVSARLTEGERVVRASGQGASKAAARTVAAAMLLSEVGEPGASPSG